ncbi:MAG: efflux RND transporter permease subunit [Planctomycetaceae bacterium]
MGAQARGWRWLLLALFALLALLAGLRLPRLVFDHDTRSLLQEDAAEDLLESELARRFGSDDILLVAWPVRDLLEPSEFRRLRTITQALSGLPGLEETYSLASATVPLPLDRLRPLEEADLEEPDRAARARKAILASPVYVGTLTNELLDVAAVATTLRPGTRSEREAAVRAVRAAVALHFPQGQEPFVAGVSALAMDANEYAVKDLESIGTLALAASVLVLWVLRRSLKETALAVGATAFPPLYALGAAASQGIAVTALGAALFPVLAVVGITSSVYLLDRYGEERARGRSARDASWGAARALAFPILMSLLTTAAGFFMLRWTGVPAFRSAGSLVGLGVLLAIPVILVGLPAALDLLDLPPRERRSRRAARALLRLGLFVRRGRLPITLGGIAVCLLGLVATSRAQVRVDVLQAFRAQSRVSLTYRFLDERLTATLPVDAVLQARPGTPMRDILRDLESFSRAAEAEPGVQSALSMASLVRYGASILGFSESVLESPMQLAAVLQILRTGFGSIVARFEEEPREGGGGRYRIKVRVREGTPPAVLGRLAEAARGRETGRMQLTGLYVRAVETAESLLANAARGTATMLLLIGMLVMVSCRSVRLGLAVILPNLLPPVAVFGGAALLELPLDISAVAVGAVAVGLAVDSSLHLLHRARAERKAGRSLDAALLRATRAVGRPLILSTAVLCAGLAFLSFSAFLPTERFGALTALSSAVALLGDLLLLPALLRSMRAL